jgi:hypothetical protein
MDREKYNGVRRVRRHKGTYELFLLPPFSLVVARVQTEERFNSFLFFIHVQTFNYDMNEIGQRHRIFNEDDVW